MNIEKGTACVAAEAVNQDKANIPITNDNINSNIDDCYSIDNEKSTILEFPEYVRSAGLQKPAWDISDDEIMDICADTNLGKMVVAQFCLGEDNTYPFAYAMANAFNALTMACSMVKEDLKESRECSNLTDVLLGAKRAKFYIKTGQGLVTQLYIIINGEPSSGKNYGDIAGQIARRFGVYISAGGTAEGILDQYIATAGNGLLDIDEGQDYLKKDTPGNYKPKVKMLLIEGFGKGYKIEKFSARSNFPSRECFYFYPQVIIRIQPNTLTKVLSGNDIDTGFLNRLLFFSHKGKEFFRPSIVSVDSVIDKIIDYSQPYLNLTGTFTPPRGYYNQIFNIFDMYPTIRDQFKGYIGRLANQFLPIFYVFLEGPNFTNSKFSNNEDTWKKAHKLCLWLFNNAIPILDSANTGKAELKETEFKNKILKYIKIHSGCLTGDISRGLTKPRGTSAERKIILQALMEDGEIFRDSTGRYYCNS